MMAIAQKCDLNLSPLPSESPALHAAHLTSLCSFNLIILRDGGSSLMCFLSFQPALSLG